MFVKISVTNTATNVVNKYIYFFMFLCRLFMQEYSVDGGSFKNYYRKKIKNKS